MPNNTPSKKELKSSSPINWEDTPKAPRLVLDPEQDALEKNEELFHSLKKNGLSSVPLTSMPHTIIRDGSGISGIAISIAQKSSAGTSK